MEPSERNEFPFPLVRQEATKLHVIVVVNPPIVSYLMETFSLGMTNARVVISMSRDTNWKRHQRSISLHLFIFQFTFVTCCVKSEESEEGHYQSVADFLAQKDWVRRNKLLHLCACHTNSQRRQTLRRGVSQAPDVSELFGLLGVPIVVILDSSGTLTGKEKSIERQT